MESASPDGGFLLRKKVLDWTQETGLVPSVNISVDGKIYNLHMQPLIQKCRYFKFHLPSSLDSVELPWNFPGGSDAFERIGLFVYQSPLPLDPSNIVAVRCAAEFLGMTENLCKMAEVYLNQVILNDWDGTFTILKSCQPLLALADQLLIVTRCVESISFTVLKEIVHLEEEEYPMVDDLVVTTIFERFRSGEWSWDEVRELGNRVVWMNDLILLPMEFFRRVINSLRRRGMREIRVVAMMGLYASRWVLSSKGDGRRRTKASLALRGIIDLLPEVEESEENGAIIPVGFYFTLLAKAMSFRVREEYKVKLQDRIVHLLHMARFEDLLLLGEEEEEVASSVEIEAVKSIFSKNVDDEERGDRHKKNANERAEVVHLWDRYLSRIATSSEMDLNKFHQLIRMVPAKDRRNHDRLYKAIDTFFLNQAELTVEERCWICKAINCRRLSEEVRAEAIRNERMPIRAAMRILFAQQLSTQEVLGKCSSASRNPVSSSWAMEGGEGRRALGSLMLKDIALRRLGVARDEYESARMKVEMLEDELASLKEEVGGGNDYLGAAATSEIQVPGDLRIDVRRKVRVRVAARVRARGCAPSLTWILRRRFAVKLVRLLARMGRHRRSRT